VPSITTNHRTIRMSICRLMNMSVKTVTMGLLPSSLLKNLKLNQKSNVLNVKVIMCRKKSRNLPQKQAKNHSLCGLTSSLKSTPLKTDIIVNSTCANKYQQGGAIWQNADFPSSIAYFFNLLLQLTSYPLRMKFDKSCCF